MVQNYPLYEDWLKEPAHADAVKQACIMEDYDPTGEVTAQLISDWFFDYHIGWKDGEKFERYLTRNLRAFIPQYREKLRNQPGIGVTLDNLVTIYRERELKQKGDSETTRTHKDDTTIYGKTVTTTPSGSQVTEQEGSEEHAKSGGHLEKYTEGKHKTTVSPKVQRVTQESGGDKAYRGDSSLQAQLPLSKEYSEFTTVDYTQASNPQLEAHAKEGMPTGLDWSTASAQAQSYAKELHDSDHKTTESFVYGAGVDGDITTTEGDSAAPDERQTTFQDEKDVTTFQGRKTVVSYEGRKDITEDGGTDRSTYGDITDKGSHDATDRERVTGRDGDAATLLQRAIDFIGRSNAWIWFRGQIEPCFLTDIEE